MFKDHEFDPVTPEEEARRRQEEEFARRVRREVLRIERGEADEDIRADMEREEEEKAEEEERQRRELRSENIDEQARHYGLERQPGETDLELKKRIAFLKQAERRAGNR